MAYVFNGATKTVTLTTGTTSVVMSDLYSRWVDWVRTSDNSKYLQAFRVTGGESDGTGGFTGSYIFIMNGWSIVPQSANHTLVINGNLFRDPEDLSGTPIIQTVAGYTISVILSRSSLAQGIETGGGGFTSGDRTTLNLISSNAATARKAVTNRYLIDETADTGTLYDDNGTTPLVTHDLKDQNGNPSDTRVYERVPR